jgi:hypothetical protein
MRHAFRFLLFALALVALPAAGFAYEEQSLLTPDGSLHTVRAGKAVDLAVTGTPSPDSFVIDWTMQAQDGTIQTSIIPGTISYQEKRGLQLTYDEATGKLVLIWIEEVSAYSHVRVGVLQDGAWTNSPLMPMQGISRAYNPQVSVVHIPVSWLDENDKPVTATSSILSVIWWEESVAVEARYAALFLDEPAGSDGSLGVYEMPSLIGGSTQSSYDDEPPGAYLYPALQVDGFSGTVLASFADLNDKQEKVVRVDFPRDRGKPSDPTSVNWKRRHAPIVSIQLTGPVARMTPILANPATTVPIGTSLGSGYRPTFYWLDGDGASLKFSRLDGPDWSPVRSITIDDTMTYEKARDLVVGMGQRN